MGFWEFMGGVTPGGAVASAAREVSESVFHGISEIIRDFKLPPEQALAAETKVAELKAQTDIKLAEAASLALVTAAGDRASARQREIALGGNTTIILAFAIVFGFLAMVTTMILAAMFGFTMDPQAMGIIGTLIGYLSAKSELVLSYYFGSSVGSASKTATIDRIVQQGTPPTPPPVSS